MEKISLVGKFQTVNFEQLHLFSPLQSSHLNKFLQFPLQLFVACDMSNFMSCSPRGLTTDTVAVYLVCSSITENNFPTV